MRSAFPSSRFSRVVFPALLLALVAGSGGCLVVDGALTDPREAKVAGDLAGVWRTTKDGDQVHLFVGKAPDVKGEPAGLMTVFWVTYKSADKSVNREADFTFTVSEVGKGRFMNVFSPDGKPKVGEDGGFAAWLADPKHVCALAYFEVRGRKLVVRISDDKPLKALAEAGKIAKSKATENAYDLASVRKFIEAGGTDELFPKDKDEVVFERVGD